MQYCTPQCYVDDTNLLLSLVPQEEREVRDKMNQDLLKIRNWSFDNQPLLNPDKTKLMIFGSRQNIAKVNYFNLSLLGKELVPATTAKDLGVILDSNLTFHDHVIPSVSSCMPRLPQINRVKHSFDKQSLITMINALVFSKLFYCSTVWSNTSRTNSSKLQAVQIFACRVVSGKRKFDHITPAFKESHRLPVNELLHYRHAMMECKCMKGRAPGYLSAQFIRPCDVAARRTRNSQMFSIPLFRTPSSQRPFYYTTVTLWNS